jgi:hypothetical protein
MARNKADLETEITITSAPRHVTNIPSTQRHLPSKVLAESVRKRPIRIVLIPDPKQPQYVDVMAVFGKSISPIRKKLNAGIPSRSIFSLSASEVPDGDRCYEYCGHVVAVTASLCDCHVVGAPCTETMLGVIDFDIFCDVVNEWLCHDDNDGSEDEAKKCLAFVTSHLQDNDVIANSVLTFDTVTFNLAYAHIETGRESSAANTSTKVMLADFHDIEVFLYESENNNFLRIHKNHNLGKPAMNKEK